MAQVLWRYPDKRAKISPKPFRCSKCRRVVEKGESYTRTNHGRFCFRCKRLKAQVASPIEEEQRDTELEPEEATAEVGGGEQ